MSDIALQITGKRCSRCEQIKDFSMFNKDRSKADGHHNQCRACQKEYLQKNKEKRNVRDREYYQQNLDRKKAYYQAYKKRQKGDVYYRLRPLLYEAKSRAKSKGLPFDLTMEWLKTMVISHCPITLQPIDWAGEQVVDGKPGPNSPSIDKIIPKLGYVQSNCAILSHSGNSIKSDGTIDEHRRVVQYMAAQQLRDIEF